MPLFKAEVPTLELFCRGFTWCAVLDKLVYGDNKAQNILNDIDLLNLFNKAQKLSKKQKETVKDFLSAFVLKIDLTEKLIQ